MDIESEQPTTSKTPSNQGFLLRFVKLFLRWPYFILSIFSFNLGGCFVCLMVNNWEFNTEISFGSALMVAWMGVVFAWSVFIDDGQSDAST